MSVLQVLKDELNGIAVPYEFMEWTDPVQGTYWVGELSEVPTVAEDGGKESTVILTGTANGKLGGSWLELEEARAKIESHFHPICGLHKSTDDGAVAIFYSNSFPVPTGEADLKRIQINLQVKEWRNIQ